MLVNDASVKYLLRRERDSLQCDLERTRQTLRLKIKALDLSKKRSEKRLAANVENVEEIQKIKVVLKRLAEDALTAAQIGIESIEDAKQLRDRVAQLEQQLLQGAQQVPPPMLQPAAAVVVGGGIAIVQNLPVIQQQLPQENEVGEEGGAKKRRRPSQRGGVDAALILPGVASRRSSSNGEKL